MILVNDQHPSSEVSLFTDVHKPQTVRGEILQQPADDRWTLFSSPRYRSISVSVRIPGLKSRFPAQVIAKSFESVGLLMWSYIKFSLCNSCGKFDLNCQISELSLQIVLLVPYILFIDIPTSALFALNKMISWLRFNANIAAISWRCPRKLRCFKQMLFSVV